MTTECPSCGSATTPGTTVCVTCGEPLASPERKLVTLLFADLTGYTELCSQLDPEDVHGFVRPAMTSLRRVVESYGGSVPSMQGDGFMATFGVPVAHEDDAERAVRAAAALQSQVAQLNSRTTGMRIPDLHVGVNTGEVLVAGSREASGFSLAGDAVNLAARLCGLSTGGRALVAESTRALTSSAATFGPRILQQVRGLPEPVAAYELLDVTPERVARPGRRHGIVGRHAELARVDEVRHDVVARGRSHLLLVTGEAGVGKTRLLDEVAARAAEDWQVLRGGASPYGESLPFSALTNAVAALAGVSRRSGEHEVTQGLRRLLSGLSLGERAESIVRTLAGLSSEIVVGESTGTGEALVAAARALRVMVEAIAAKRPTLVLLDDLQWADVPLWELLDDIAARPWSSPVLVVGSCREGVARGQGAEVLRLEALSDSDMSAVLVDLFGVDPPAWLVQELLARAGGNPLFLEELAGLLRESGAVVVRDGRCEVADADLVLQVPASLRMFIAARLDVLPPHEKAVLQDASVCGGETWDIVLRRLAPDRDPSPALAGLTAAGLLVHRSSSAVPGAAEYAFKHVVIRDVAYESLPRRARSLRHSTVAQTLRDLAAENELFQPQPSVLAHHYEQAWALGRSPALGIAPAPALARLAVTHMLRWARHLLRYQAQSAFAVLGRAVEIAESSADAVPASSEVELRVLAARAMSELGSYDGALEHARRARELCDQPDVSDVQRADALDTEGHIRSYRLEMEQARELLAAAHDLYTVAGDLSGQALTLRHLAETWRLTDLGQLIETLKQAYALYTLAGDREGRATLAQDIAYAETMRGGREFVRWYDEARRLVEDSSDLRGQAALLRARGVYETNRGEYAEAGRLFEAARRVAVEAGNRWVEADALIGQTQMRVATGDLVEARSSAVEAAELAQRIDWPRLHALALLQEAVVSGREGQPEAAWRLLRVGRDEIVEMGVTFSLAEADEAEAQVALDQGVPGRAMEAATRAMESWSALEGRLSSLLPASVRARAALLSRQPSCPTLLADLARAAAGLEADWYASLATALAAQWELLEGREPEFSDVGLATPELRAIDAENRGLSALAHHDAAAAATSFAAAVDAWATLGVTVWRARAQAWLLDALGRSEAPDVEDAGAELARLRGLLPHAAPEIFAPVGL